MDSNPFYDLFATSTPSSSLGNPTTEDYDYDPEIVCANFTGYSYSTAEGVKYGWDGLPVHVHINDQIDRWVTASMIVCAIFGIALNIFCWRVIFKNHHLSRSALYYLVIDCFCRFYGACTQFYKAYCVLTWTCVNVDGYPFTGLILNQIINGANVGMGPSMTMIGSGLSMNRFFAVYFNGRLYNHMKLIALPHAAVLWAMPVVVYLSQIGILKNAKTGFLCYAGYFFTPLNYCTTTSWASAPFTEFLKKNFYYLIYSVQGVTFFLDLLTLWKVRRLKKAQHLKSRADIRLSFMLVITHLIAIVYYMAKKLLTNTHELPIFYYLWLELVPFLMHCVLGVVVIVYNLPPRATKTIDTIKPSTHNTKE